MKIFMAYMRFLKNKYVIVLLFTLIWMLFFDRYDLVSRLQAHRKLRALKEDERYYREKINEIRKSQHELLTNPQTLEKFARERYFMKKDNEDIFIIEKGENQ